MSTQRQLVTAHDLVEEAKKRIVILSVCVVGLAYLMSCYRPRRFCQPLSTSVWVNLPVAAFLVILFRYFALDFEMRRKAAAFNNRTTNGNIAIQEKHPEGPKAAAKKERLDYWRRKVNSPLVEDAIDKFTRHLVSEWVTDLWYGKLTPDREGPEELVQLMNGVMGEISFRMRNVNLIDLLARDVIHLICKHLEVFRACQAKTEKNLALLSSDQRDMELKIALAAENKLHPLLFSAESEHKAAPLRDPLVESGQHPMCIVAEMVLQHIVNGLISYTFKREDLECSFFRYVVRELLACAVLRPVLNLVNPRFVNERIEQVVVSAKNKNKGASTANNGPSSKENGLRLVSSDDFSPFPDPSASGVELVSLKSTQSKSSTDKNREKVSKEKNSEEVNSEDSSKDPLLSVDTRSSRSWSAFAPNSLEAGGSQIERSSSGGEWGDMLDYFSRRKTQALTPEHFENMWSKGRDYKSKDVQGGDPVHQSSVVRSSAINSSNAMPRQERGAKLTPAGNVKPHTARHTSMPPPVASDDEEEEHKLTALDETESRSSSHYSSEDEKNSVTGLDSPTTIVWAGRVNRSSGASYIRHPLESLDGKKTRRTSRGHNQKLDRQHSCRKRSRLGSQKVPVWQEAERTSFLSGDGQDTHPLKQNLKDDDSSDDYDMEITGRLQSGSTASSSASSLPGTFSSAVNAPQSAFLGDTFFKLRCEVLGANIVSSSSKMFAVYCISVTDAENNSWSIKRRWFILRLGELSRLPEIMLRYRHFEELHRRLKQYPEYNLHLPPKHFLSTGLDVPVIQERCKLLDEYLKKLMQLPTVSGSIDVWDFLSIDSQTYTFSSAFSIIETLSVGLDYRPSANNSRGPMMDHLKPRKDCVEPATKGEPSQMNHGSAVGLKCDVKGMDNSPKRPAGQYGKVLDAGGGSEKRLQNKPHSAQDSGKNGREAEGQQKSELFLDAASDATLPAEWVPPNLSGPILDLVDVVFQLQEGAWIRRKAFWVAKQVLQLGMGDALDDWLVEKIQRLRKGSVVAFGIKRVEQILWPDGIFITKHPKRQRPSGSSSHQDSQRAGQESSPKQDDFREFIEQQEREAERRAKFVFELMVDNAPAPIVSLVGHKEYEQCAKDLYFFLQSPVCLKLLVLDLLQLVLLHAFPELDNTFKQLSEERYKFGEFKPA
ncbi:hypothetical protein Cgig2_016632 [Carnegiea gigantea]|uniref:Uncharacterized protein n=1 Tax=Carnegiea gigantea TaxID=171969 RepID=A0A9Q1KWA2_9CARY|nr:hypothetical protein Cgig2_016632 [Carnegiea gigantea]